MSYQLFRINKNTFEHINEIENIKSIKWSDDLKNVFTSFEFVTTEVLECGDWIELRHREDDNVVLRGIIFTCTRDTRDFYKYNGYDTGIYLEKNNLTKQFKKEETLSGAITNVCDDLELPIGTLDINSRNINVSGVHRNEKASEIIKKVYKSANENGLVDAFYFDCKDGYINFKRYEENNTFRGVVANTFLIDSFRFISGFNISQSIEKMKTRVQLYPKESSNKNQVPKSLLTRGRPESVEKYGVLNHIEEVEKNTEKKYIETAEKKLAELCKVEETVSLTVHGDYNLHKGVITFIQNNILGIENTYLLTSTEHTISGTTEQVKINVKVFVVSSSFRDT